MMEGRAAEARAKDQGANSFLQHDVSLVNRPHLPAAFKLDCSEGEQDGNGRVMVMAGLSGLEAWNNI